MQRQTWWSTCMTVWLVLYQSLSITNCTVKCIQWLFQTQYSKSGGEMTINCFLLLVLVTGSCYWFLLLVLVTGDHPMIMMATKISLGTWPHEPLLRIDFVVLFGLNCYWPCSCLAAHNLAAPFPKNQHVFHHVFAVLGPTCSRFATKRLLWIQITRNPMENEPISYMDQWRNDYMDRNSRYFPASAGFG